MLETYLDNNVLLMVVLILWVLPWKGYALWTASKKNHKFWFILMLILNTFAIVEIIYIFYIAKKTPNEVKGVLNIFKKKKHHEEQK